MPLSLQDLQSGNYSAAISTATDATGTTGLVFDASAIAGDASKTYATASDLLNTFDQTKVDLTGAQAEAQTNKLVAAMQLIPGVGQVIGGALYAITQAGGFAHAGAGVCATDPPASSGLGDLKRWSHYTPWQRSSANSAPDYSPWEPGSDPRGSFEELANNALAYNRALQDNCFSTGAIPFPVLLAQIVQAWNGTHSGPSRTVSRRVSNGQIGETIPGYDPLSYALEVAGGYAATGKTMSLVVNGGAQIPKTVLLHLSPGAIISSADGASFTATSPASALSTAKKLAIVALIGVGAGAAGIGVYALATHQSYGKVAGSIWKSTGGKVTRRLHR